MADISKLLTIIGIALIVLAGVLKLGGTWLIIGQRGIRLVSILVMANSCFLLALIAKK